MALAPTGTLLLGCLQAKAELPVKNTFVHFADRRRQLRRSITDPASPTQQHDIAEGIKPEKLPEGSKSAEPQGAGEGAAGEPKDDSLSSTEASSEDEQGDSTETEEEDAEQPQGTLHIFTTWRVDARKLSGSTRSISKEMCFQVAGRSASFVVTLFPTPVSNKRGGASFKASDGKGYFQMKANQPTDAWLTITAAVGVGAAPRSVQHNFMDHGVLRFPGDFDFRAAVDEAASPPSLEINIDVQPSLNGGPPENTSSGDSSPMRSTTPPPIRKEQQQTQEVQTPQPRWSSKSQWTALQPEKPAKSPSSSFMITDEGGGALFGFTIRRAGDGGLGLEIARVDNGLALLVESVFPGGAIDAWNRQCVDGSRAVMPGDKILTVNGKVGCEEMLAECRSVYLLRLEVSRGDPDCALRSPVPEFPCEAAVEEEVAIIPEVATMREGMVFQPVPEFTCEAAVEEEVETIMEVATMREGMVSQPMPEFSCEDALEEEVATIMEVTTMREGIVFQ